MSNTETGGHIGRLREIPLHGILPETWAYYECDRLDLLYNRDFDEWIDILNDYYFQNREIRHPYKYHIIGSRLFEIIDDVEIEENEDIALVTPLPDGSYSFVMRYFNDDTNFREILGLQLSKLPKK